jgi:hypothetical protein
MDIVVSIVRELYEIIRPYLWNGRRRMSDEEDVNEEYHIFLFKQKQAWMDLSWVGYFESIKYHGDLEEYWETEPFANFCRMMTMLLEYLGETAELVDVTTDNLKKIKALARGEE